MPRRRTRRPPSATVLVGELSIGVTLLGFAALAGYELIRRPWTNRIDAAGFREFPAGVHAHLFNRIVEIGSLPFLLGGIALAILLSVWRDVPRAIACVVGPVAAVLVTEQVAKPLVARHLTAFGGDSYPSGTVAAAAALVAVVTLAVPLALRPAVALAGCGVIVAVGIAVVGLRWHYPTDAIGGACVGVGSVLTLDALAHLPSVIGAAADRRHAARVPDRYAVPPRREDRTEELPRAIGGY
jgi:membrane-associated phospholipid phosphatase